MRRSATSLLGLTSVVLLRCATTVCAATECPDRLEVGFTGATGNAGRYEIAVVTDGVAATCEITLPRTCGTEPVCSRTDLPWTVKLSGCSNGTAETITALVFRSAPSTVDFVVRRDDMLVGEAKLRPEYVESHPNGPECGICSTAARQTTAIAP